MPGPARAALLALRPSFEAASGRYPPIRHILAAWEADPDPDIDPDIDPPAIPDDMRGMILVEWEAAGRY